MATFNKFNSFSEALAEKVHDLQSDTLKLMLTNVAPSASNTVKANITEISPGNGYTAGGETLTVTSSSQSGGVYKLVVNDVTWTATGAMAGFRYIVIYNDTATNKELIGWWDYGSTLSLTAGQAFTWDTSPTNGILQLS